MYQSTWNSCSTATQNKELLPLKVSGSKLLHVNTYPSCFLVKNRYKPLFLGESGTKKWFIPGYVLGLGSWENFISLHVLLQSKKTVSMEILQNENNLLTAI